MTVHESKYKALCGRAGSPLSAVQLLLIDSEGLAVGEQELRTNGSFKTKDSLKSRDSLESRGSAKARYTAILLICITAVTIGMVCLVIKFPCSCEFSG